MSIAKVQIPEPPQLGQKVYASDRVVRQYDGRRRESFWGRCGDRRAFPRKPVEGVYVGQRTYQRGTCHWGGEGHTWEQTGQLKVWLIVDNQHRNPVPVLPEDCVWGDSND